MRCSRRPIRQALALPVQRPARPGDFRVPTDGLSLVDEAWQTYDQDGRGG
jgi:hypothetical protein